jgi:hypothetical protein
VWVGVEDAVEQHLPEQVVEQPARQGRPVEITVEEPGLGGVDRRAVQPLHDEDALGAQLRVDRRNMDRGDVAVACGDGAEVVRLDPVVELLADRCGQPVGQRPYPDGTSPRRSLLEAPRDALGDVQVAFDRGTDARALHFDDHVGAGSQSCDVYLSDRGGGERCTVEAGEDLVDRGAELSLQNSLDVCPRHRPGAVLKAAQLVDHLCREQVPTRRQDLSQLDEGDAPGVEGLAERPAELPVPAGAVVASAGVAQERPQAVTQGDADDLPVPSGPRQPGT